MVNVIAAVDDRNGLARNGEIPWHNSEDMKFFKEITINKPVIMGRKTFESLPDAFRPLPNRHNIVISRTFKEEDNLVETATSIRQAIQKAKKHNTDVFVIGGCSIYWEVLKRNWTDRLYLSRIPGDYKCDQCFPTLGTDWTLQKTKQFGTFRLYEYDYFYGSR